MRPDPRYNGEMALSNDEADRSTLVIAASVVLLFLSFAGFLWLADLLRFDGSDASAKVVGATLALAGAFGASLFSLVGVMLKHSIDIRTEKRLRLESDRNDVARSESEQRLKLEACIRAVQLLSTPAGTPAPPAQITGALLTLISLEQYELVLELVEEFLRQKQLDSGTVAGLLDPVMTKGDAGLQSAVVGLLYRREADFVNSDGLLELPACFFAACDRLSFYARTWVPIFIARAIMKHPTVFWRKDKAFLYGLVGALGFQYQKEPDADLKSNIGAILAAFLEIFPELRVAHVAAGTVNLDDLRPAVAGLVPRLSAAAATVEQIQQWRAAAPGAA
jgi:hypothetical protein